MNPAMLATGSVATLVAICAVLLIWLVKMATTKGEIKAEAKEYEKSWKGQDIFNEVQAEPLLLGDRLVTAMRVLWQGELPSTRTLPSPVGSDAERRDAVARRRREIQRSRDLDKSNVPVLQGIDPGTSRE